MKTLLTHVLAASIYGGLCAAAVANGSSPTTVLNSGQRVHVLVDFAEMVTMPRAIGTVVVGNTAIIDANPTDDRSLLLTGKSVGTTNIIAIDEEGKRMANFTVLVETDSPNKVTVHQGDRLETYSCATKCDALSAPATQ